MRMKKGAIVRGDGRMSLGKALGEEGLWKGDQRSAVERLAESHGGLYTPACICEYLCVNCKSSLMDAFFGRASHR